MLSLGVAYSGFAGNGMAASRISQSSVAPQMQLERTFWKSGGDAAPAGGKKQDFLEAEPYWDQSTVPVNTYKNKAPFVAKVISVKRIVGPEATGETCDIVMDHQGKMPYWEGQSYGVIPPGTNPKNGKPNSVRLYSIASSRYGDDMTGTTTTLCVRRATYWCPELKADDPAKKGVCSNFLCDATPGTDLKLTGPSGKVMLIPEKDPNVDLIMVRCRSLARSLPCRSSYHHLLLWRPSPVHPFAAPPAFSSSPERWLASLLGCHRHRHCSLPQLPQTPVCREDPLRRGLQGPRVALPGRGKQRRAPVR